MPDGAGVTEAELPSGAGPWAARLLVFWRLARQWRSTPAALCGALGILGAVVLLGPVADAQFGAIDDHEILELLGPGYRLPLAAVPAAVLSTEVGSPGRTLRYRPFYYTARTLEISLFADHPRPYYLLRLGLFALFLSVAFWAATVAVGPLWGVLVVGLMADLPFWGDVWARLGPAEQYASAGFALFLLGFTRIVRALWGRDPRGWNASLLWMSAGVVIAAGSKENFALMALPLVVLAVAGWRRGRVGGVGLAGTALGAAFAAFVVAAAFGAVLFAGGDIHGEGAGARARAFQTFFAQFGQRGHPYAPTGGSLLRLELAFAAVVAAAVALALLRRIRPPADPGEFRRRLRFVAAIDGLALLWLAWEIVFYAGEWPTGVRYDFPGMLAVAVFAGSVVSLAAPWLARDQAVGVPATVALVGAALLARYAVADPLFPIHRLATVDVASTTRFNADLTRSAQAAAAHARWPIYVEAVFPSDYEKALTLPTWLRWKGIANPLFIRLHSWQPEGRAASEFERGLRTAMADVSARGGYGYAPLSRENPAAEAAGHCFTVSYSGPPEPPCAELTIRPW